MKKDLNYQLDNSSPHPKFNHRSCTDIFCFVIWVAFWVTIIVFAGIGFAKGDIRNFFQPQDSDGRLCGRDTSEEFPHLYLDNPFSKDYAKKMVCVKECPKTDTDKIECIPNNEITSCDDL